MSSLSPHLQRPGRKGWLIGLSLPLALFLLFAFWLLYDLPSLDRLSQTLPPPSIRILDRHGTLLYEVGEEGRRNLPLTPEEIPPCIKQATIAVEDQSFYTNPGLDLRGVLRALYLNLRGGETLAGGSTITQQVVRNLLLPEERTQRTLRRKLRETLLAWLLTRHLSKEQILTLYLNQTYYGGFAYGIEAAAQTYFGKPASQLYLEECALLAGLPQAPARYDPFKDLEAARQRQRTVLELMEKQGFISAQQREQAEAAPLFLNPRPYPILAPHFVWMVKTELDSLQARQVVPVHQPLIVYTTLDLAAQQVAEEAIARQLNHLHNDQGVDHQVSNAAAVVLDPHSGDILALVGSADYFDASIRGAINMALVPRQPGSAFKPFIYAAAFDPGLLPDPWTAATPILDVRTNFRTADGKIYTPQNYDGREHGLVPARVALASSFNIPAVAALQKVGVERMSAYASRFGITALQNPSDYDLTLALGGGRVSLLELTNAYAVFARGGLYLPPRLILEIQDPAGHTLYRAPAPSPQPVLDARIAWLISDILSDPLARQPGFGRYSTLQIERPAAVKTGTTTDFHDNWTIGYTPDLVVGVWVGNSDYRPMREVTGLSGAAPIWQSILRTLLRNRPAQPFLRPSGLVRVKVCTLSGLLPTDACMQTHEEWFLEETVPAQPDNVYLRYWQNSLSGAISPAPSAGPGAWQPLLVLRLPPEAWDWARRQGWRLEVDVQGRGEKSFLAAGPGSEPGASLWLLNPRPGDRYFIAPELPRSEQRLHLQAMSRLSLRSLTFWVDNHSLVTLTAWPYEAWWPLEPGEHIFHVEALTSEGELVRSEPVPIHVETRP